MNSTKIINEFGKHQMARNYAQSTVQWNRKILEWFFDYLKQHNIDSLEQINTQTILNYQMHLAETENRSGRSYNPRTQNYCISAIRSLFKYLRCSRQVTFDPTDGVELAKAPRPLPKNIMSIDEIVAMLRQPDTGNNFGVRDRVILEVLYATGMRRSECANLNIEDINLSDGTAFIRNGKGGRDRVVPLTASAKRWLKRYINHSRPHLLNNADEPAVFINKYGKRLSKNGHGRIVKCHAQSAGIKKNISPHCIRHTIATHLTDAGCSIRYIQELLGHSRLDTTAIYITVSGAALKKAIKRHHPRG